MKKKIRVKELMHLDVPLMVVELNNRGEYRKNIPWCDEAFTFTPYIVYERRDGFVYAYFDKVGIAWKTEMAGKYADFEKLKSEITTRYSKIKDILINEKTLGRDELLEFLYDVENIWTWLDCMWWRIEYQEKNKLNTGDSMKLRKETEYFAPGLFSVIRKSLANIYPELKDYVDVIKIDEFSNNQIPRFDVLNSRISHYGYATGKLYESFDQIKSLYSIEFESFDLETRELRGQTAYPGLVRGRVKKIEKRSDMDDFKSGDIIVSSTTTPDYLPVMRIAGAIVSEHGGIICHAAITSRELKIPCVTGVTAVTQILKNGDIVEVDADNGIVRIIK